MGLAGDRNPIVHLWLLGWGIIAITRAPDARGFLAAILLIGIIIILLNLSLRPLVEHVRLILPWAMFFFGIHAGFTYFSAESRDLLVVLNSEVIVLLRLVGLAAVTGIVRQGVSAQRLIDSLKSASDGLGVKSHLVEDALQVFRLILLFIPRVVKEFRLLEHNNRAFGFRPPATLMGRSRFYGNNLLPVLESSLNRAAQMGNTMDSRGYGEVLPRGQLAPEPFRSCDLIALAGIAFAFSLIWMI